MWVEGVVVCRAARPAASRAPRKRCESGTGHGAQQGIGRAIALEFAAAGADIVINWLGAAQRVADEVRACGPRAILVQADVAQIEQVRAMVSTLQEGFGPIDVLINNAAVFHASLSSR